MYAFSQCIFKHTSSASQAERSVKKKGRSAEEWNKRTLKKKKVKENSNGTRNEHSRQKQKKKGIDTLGLVLVNKGMEEHQNIGFPLRAKRSTCHIKL